MTYYPNEDPMRKSVALSYVQKFYPDITKVVDAKRGTKITVTPKDCTNAVGKAANLCAIAKAAMRHYDGAIVSLSRAYLIKGDTAVRYEVPGHVTRELVVFDRSHNFEPGIYRLDRVTKPHRIGQGSAWKPRKRKGIRAKSKARHFTGGVRALVRHP